MDGEELRNRLNEIRDKVNGIDEPRPNRIYIECETAGAFEVNRFLFEDIHARFVIATVSDCDDYFEVIYHWSYDGTGAIINIRVFIRDRDNPSIDSITPILPAAEWIEREMYDLMGVKFVGHPRPERLILADDWPEGVYPMRKETTK